MINKIREECRDERGRKGRGKVGENKMKIGQQMRQL